MWLSYNTIVYKHVPTKFLRRKRNEKSRQKQICNKTLVFVSHQTSSCCTCNERWLANCNWAQAHHQTSQELFFTISLTEFGIRKVFIFSFFLFLLLFPFFFFFCKVFDLKNHNQKVPETNSWLIKGD